VGSVWKEHISQSVHLKELSVYNKLSSGYLCIPSVGPDNREYTVVLTILLGSTKGPSYEKCLGPTNPLIRPWLLMIVGVELCTLDWTTKVGRDHFVDQSMILLKWSQINRAWECGLDSFGSVRDQWRAYVNKIVKSWALKTGNKQLLSSRERIRFMVFAIRLDHQELEKVHW
jgi:hypothetical protein